MRSLLLRSMSPGDSMDMGKGYDNMIGCATCNLSHHLMQKVLLPCFILVISSCFNPHVYLITELWTCILTLYQFYNPLILSQVFALVAT